MLTFFHSIIIPHIFSSLFYFPYVFRGDVRVPCVESVRRRSTTSKQQGQRRTSIPTKGKKKGEGEGRSKNKYLPNYFSSELETSPFLTVVSTQIHLDRFFDIWHISSMIPIEISIFHFFLHFFWVRYIPELHRDYDQEFSLFTFFHNFYCRGTDHM